MHLPLSLSDLSSGDQRARDDNLSSARAGRVTCHVWARFVSCRAGPNTTQPNMLCRAAHHGRSAAQPNPIIRAVLASAWPTTVHSVSWFGPCWAIWPSPAQKKLGPSPTSRWYGVSLCFYLCGAASLIQWERVRERD